MAGIAVDVVLFTIEDDHLDVLLIKRNKKPFKNGWALPGGFIQKNETAEKTALRVLKKEAGVNNIYLEQLYTFSDINRDPRGRIISISFFALARKDKTWFKGKELLTPTLTPLSKITKLIFDHNKILNYAIQRLKAKLEYTNIAYSLLEPEFTLTELQHVYEIIFKAKIDKRNFRKKYLSLGLIQATEKFKRGAKQRPARLFEFKSKKVAQLKKFF
jgi:8-oxo-dGTP diphosphatase